MPGPLTIDVDLTKTCACGKEGVVGGTGLCLSCLAERVENKRPDKAIRVRKVRYDGKCMQIAYERPNHKQEWDQYTIECTEAPRPELVVALQALAPLAREILELPEDEPNAVSVRSLTCTWAGPDKDVMGCVVSLVRSLAHSTGMVNMVTPYRIEKPYTKSSDTGQLMEPKLLGRVNAVHAEAMRYIAGERQQANLFDKGQETARV